MRIAVIGSGGVGGYFGGRLAAAGADVTFFARGAHLQAIRERGLRIESPSGHLHLREAKATDDPASVGAVDVVFFTVKLYDSDAAVGLLPPLIGPETVVIPFQNGVESVDLLTRSVGASHVAGGTAYVFAVISEPGVVRHTIAERLIFGELNGERTPRLARLLEASERAGFSATLSDHIEVDIWTKFVWLTAFSGMTTVTRSPFGIVRDDADLFAMLQAACLEGIAVGRTSGVALPRNIFDNMMKLARDLPADTKSSMLVDLEHGRRLELAWLSGAVARLGQQAGLETPVHRFISTILRPHAAGRPASAGDGK